MGGGGGGGSGVGARFAEYRSEQQMKLAVFHILHRPLVKCMFKNIRFRLKRGSANLLQNTSLLIN